MPEELYIGRMRPRTARHQEATNCCQHRIGDEHARYVWRRFGVDLGHMFAEKEPRRAEFLAHPAIVDTGFNHRDEEALIYRELTRCELTASWRVADACHPADHSIY